MSATLCVPTDTEATKLSVPVVWADPVDPPAICWLMATMDTGSAAAPTVSLAVTPLGLSPIPSRSSPG